MKIKTTELTGRALDWAVAKVEGTIPPISMNWRKTWLQYSTNWAQGGPIIERESIDTGSVGITNWRAHLTTEEGPSYWADGPTPLIAAMRCFVASKLGDEVEVPDELT